MVQCQGGFIFLAATSTCENSNHFKGIRKRQVQRKLTVPSHKQTLLHNSNTEEKGHIGKPRP